MRAATHTTTLTAAVQAYLHETLGADVQILPWRGAQQLPYFLQDAFEVHEMHLRDKRVLLASARRSLPALSTLRTQLDKLANLAGLPVVFATNTLASYERKRLVQQKVPFVVPGNQLYLPDLGIDFREYFRQLQAEATAFSPATQAIFIAALLRKEWEGQLKAAEIVAALGYTLMTLSRAIRELSAAGLISTSQRARARELHVNHTPAQAWQHAMPFLRSPVKRVMWVAHPEGAKSIRPLIAGLSALASYSMLVEPERPVYAVGPAQWRVAQAAGVKALPATHPDAFQWEVWSYAPNLMPEATIVDPLSLSLSLKDEKDDRVQQALDELRSYFPW